jgi:2-dehydro-3-deoxygluconokinase
MVDLFAEVSPETLGGLCARFGLDHPVRHVSPETAGAILAALRSPENAAAAVYSSGGGAANTAKIAAGLGVQTVFAGRVGPDSLGAFFKEELSKAGVQTRLGESRQGTGLFIKLSGGGVPGAPRKGIPAAGEWRIAASPGAALDLGPEDLPDPALSSGPDAAGPGVLMFEGFLMDRRALIRRCFDLAGRGGLRLAFDPGTADIAAGHAGEILGWCAGAAAPKTPAAPKDGDGLIRRVSFILFVNEDEAEALAAHSGGAGDTPEGKGRPAGWETLFTKLSAHAGGLLAVVKLAERGAAVFSGGVIHRAAAAPVAGAESTGAGDAFAAGFLAALLRGKGPEACGRAGNAAAALVLARPGTAGKTPDPPPGDQLITRAG